MENTALIPNDGSFKIKSFKNLPENIIPYRKEMRLIVNSVNGCILWQQLEYWFEMMKGKSFYKFLSALDEEKFGYREGDSWTEELAFSETEFRTAFSRLGTSYKSKKEFNKQPDGFKGKMYCSYFDKISRKTYYFRNNEIVDVNLRRLEKAIYEGLEISSAETEISDSDESNNADSKKVENNIPTKPDDLLPNYTENTAENTAENIQKITQENSPITPETSSGEDSDSEGEEDSEKNYSDIADPRLRLTDFKELVVLRFYKKYVYSNCHEGTHSVVVGIRRAMKIFRDRYQEKDDGFYLLLCLFKHIPNVEYYQDLFFKNPLEASPKLFLKEENIYNNLLESIGSIVSKDFEIQQEYLSYHEINEEIEAMCIEQGRKIKCLYLKPNGKPF
jgi:hypothetical protein